MNQPINTNDSSNIMNQNITGEDSAYHRFHKDIIDGSDHRRVFPGAENDWVLQYFFEYVQKYLFIGLGYLIGWLFAFLYGLIFGVVKFLFVYAAIPFATVWRWGVGLYASMLQPIFEAIGIRRHFFETNVRLRGKENV